FFEEKKKTRFSDSLLSCRKDSAFINQHRRVKYEPRESSAKSCSSRKPACEAKAGSSEEE
ncbi:hypothetical protein MKW92_004226, partial [Papaver armeniacum]